MKLRVATEIGLDEPNAGAGFVTWLDIDVLADAEDREEQEGDDDEQEGDGDEQDEPEDEEEGEEEDEPIGRARVAIIHVNEALDHGENLVEVLDADSGELEALSGVYFEDGILLPKFAEDAIGANVLYIADVFIDEEWRRRNVDFALVRRLCDTLGAGCALAVLPYETEAEEEQWGRMGFQITEPAAKGGGYMHLPLGLRNPRVVDREHTGRFRVVPNPSPTGRRKHH